MIENHTGVYQFQVTGRNAVQIFLFTLAFNTLIAVFLTVLGFGKGFTVHFIMSQCIGLTIAASIVLGFFLIRPVNQISQAGVFSVCLLSGSTAGTFLGLYLSGRNHAMNNEIFHLLQILVISVVFGSIISYFFASQDRIHQSEKTIDKERIKRLSSEKQTVEAELKMLQAQIEPHFLYNTLFNIRSLMDSDVDYARRMLDNLSGFLRLSLSCSRKENTTVDEEIRLIQDLNPDIAFLDIRMPGMSGIQVAEKIAGLCRIVFITAYDHYAVGAFENEAVDYVLKPVTEERLKKTVIRLQKQMQHSLPDKDRILAFLPKILSSATSVEPACLSWIKAQCKEGLRIIPTESIYYFTKKDPYTEVVTCNETFLISKTIKELVSELDPEHFWQIHRSTIVNARFIKDVGRSLTGRGIIRLKDRSETLTISRNYLHVFKQM